MTQKEKAKAYDEALEKARQFSEYPLQEDSANIVEYIFPELKESEDERIRKEIISALEYANHKGVYDKHIACLKKQVEQKPISFDTSTPVSYDDIPFGEKDYELHEATYFIPEGFRAEIEGDKVIVKRGEQKPSQWNISDYRTWQYIVSDVLTKHQGIGQYLDDGFCKKIAKYMQEEWSKKLSLGQNPAWSEEDEKHIDSLLERLEGMCKKGATFTKTRFAISQDMDWLKSLKQRIGG